jgi:hypothetical protein
VSFKDFDDWDLVINSDNFDLSIEEEDIARFNRMFRINFARSDWVRGGKNPKVKRQAHRINKHASSVNAKNFFAKRNSH